MAVYVPCLLVGVAMLACAQQPAGILVEPNPDRHETTYTASAPGCTVFWTVYRNETDAGVVRHRADCALTPAEQVPLLAKLLHAMTATALPASFRTLEWGRLYPDGARDTTLPVRLALAAGRSPKWDAARGAPRGGDLNGFVCDLANNPPIYEELRSVFRQKYQELKLANVEKVLVMPARQLPFFDQLRAAGAQPGGKLPFDCQAWFSIRPANHTPK
jgi:hypothetical protein